jgi:hypothetical protein
MKPWENSVACPFHSAINCLQPHSSMKLSWTFLTDLIASSGQGGSSGISGSDRTPALTNSLTRHSISTGPTFPFTVRAFVALA